MKPYKVNHIEMFVINDLRAETINVIFVLQKIRKVLILSISTLRILYKTFYFWYSNLCLIFIPTFS